MHVRHQEYVPEFQGRPVLGGGLGASSGPRITIFHGLSNGSALPVDLPAQNPRELAAGVLATREHC